MTKKVITSFNFIPVNTGKSISFTYSEIDENGNIVIENKRETFIVMNDELDENINTIIAFLNTRLEGAK